MTRRLLAAVGAAALIATLSTSVAFAGEITGNGKSLKFDGKWGTGLHARSVCAFSGQEDLQFLNDDGSVKAEATKGDPAHAQSWGQIDKATRDFLTSIGLNPGKACNPNIGEPEQ